MKSQIFWSGITLYSFHENLRDDIPNSFSGIARGTFTDKNKMTKLAARQKEHLYPRVALSLYFDSTVMFYC